MTINFLDALRNPFFFSTQCALNAPNIVDSAGLNGNLQQPEALNQIAMLPYGRQSFIKFDWAEKLQLGGAHISYLQLAATTAEAD